MVPADRSDGSSSSRLFPGLGGTECGQDGANDAWGDQPSGFEARHHSWGLLHSSWQVSPEGCWRLFLKRHFSGDMKHFRCIPISGKSELLKLGGNDHWMKVFFNSYFPRLLKILPKALHQGAVCGRSRGTRQKAQSVGNASAMLLVVPWLWVHHLTFWFPHCIKSVQTLCTEF